MEVGLPVLLVGLAFVIYAIWNMFNDPLLGYLTDRSFKWTKRWGFRAPWIVLSAFPILIFYFLIFTPPFDAKTDPLLVFLYMLIITALFDTFFSIYNSQVYAGYTNQFRTEYERRKGFSIIVAVAGFGVVGMGFIGPLLIKYGDRSTFILTALIVVIILAVANIFLFLGIKESEELKESLGKGFESTEKQGFFGLMKTAIGRKNFAISLIGYTVVITAQTLAGASGIYMMKDVFRLPLLCNIHWYSGFYWIYIINTILV